MPLMRITLALEEKGGGALNACSRRAWDDWVLRGEDMRMTIARLTPGIKLSWRAAPRVQA